MISVLYMSTAKLPFSEEQLIELLKVSKANNERVGITGMLLYKDLNFLQALEGPDAEVDALLAKIKADPRHCGVVMLIREQVQGRSFGEWSMGFLNLNRPEVLPDGFSEIMNEFDPQDFFRDPTLAQKVLAGFRDAL